MKFSPRQTKVLPLVARLALAAIDATFGIAMVACAWAALETPALAYVDPSVMTYTIQALAGVAVALSAVIGVLWRRIRRWLFKALKIDENAGKVVEPAVTEATASSNEPALIAANTQATNERKQQSTPFYPSLGWLPRFLIALCAMALLMYVNVVATPFQIVGGNQDSLIFTVLDVAVPLFAFAIIAGTLIALAISALKGKTYDIVVAVIFALGIASFIQSLFLNRGLPAADGHEVIWSDFTKLTVVSTIVWVALIAGFIVLFIKKPLYARIALVFLAFVIMAVESFSVVRYTRRALKDGDQYIVTKEDLYEVSGKNNVIVFVVDTVDTKEFDYVLEDYPDVLDAFEGFTYYHNSVGSMIPTAYGVPFLVTGETIQDDETYQEFLDRRYLDSNFISDVYNSNYSISLYADCLFSAIDLYGDMTTNIHSAASKGVDVWGTIGILTKVSLYSNMPWVAKPAFWYYTDDMNQGVLNYSTAGNSAGNDGSTPYVMDDGAYYEELCERGLTITENETTDGSFRMIHLNGAHVPFTYDENMNEVGDSTMVKQTRGVFKILEEYINDMKELGVYDNSTIIITADHGYWASTVHGQGTGQDNMSMLNHTISPICLVKLPGATGSYTTSEAPVSHIDFQPTVLAAVGADYSSYGEGTTYYEVDENADRTRRFINERYNGTDETKMDEYLINGSALDFDNWEYTGKTWGHGDAK